jgi:hypothetical protein
MDTSLGVGAILTALCFCNGVLEPFIIDSLLGMSKHATVTDIKNRFGC